MYQQLQHWIISACWCTILAAHNHHSYCTESSLLLHRIITLSAQNHHSYCTGLSLLLHRIITLAAQNHHSCSIFFSHLMQRLANVWCPIISVYLSQGRSINFIADTSAIPSFVNIITCMPRNNELPLYDD